MGFETTLRHEFLVKCGADGGSKSQFVEWLQTPEILERIGEEYEDIQGLLIHRVASHWKDRFPKTDARQLSFDGMASPTGFRYRLPSASANEDETKVWISVLADYATLYQWSLALNAQFDSMEDDRSAYDSQQRCFQLALNRAAGDLMTRIADVADEHVTSV